MKDAYSFIPYTGITPRGWYRRQLEIEAMGLAGQLDRTWRDIYDSRWVDGTAEGWERLPYWLDGFIPLAFLLKSEGMISRARHFIDEILARQGEDGWLCPCDVNERPTYDMWSHELLSKVLVLWYECTSDERIIPALTRGMKVFGEHIKKYPLFGWGKYRAFETLIAVDFLSAHTDEEWLTELEKLIREQGFDWVGYYAQHLEDEPKNEWRQESHVVNNAMVMKLSALGYGEDVSEEMYRYVMKHHGTPAGHFTGDECLSGSSPIQGAELCSIVEAMYSYELLLRHTGKTDWADRLEMVAFNSLPAQMDEMQTVRQYDQMINQIECTNFVNGCVFRTNNEEAHIFGVETNYGCCTADHGQGYPKLASAFFMQNDNAIASLVPVESEIDTVIGGTPVHITLDTDYPFNGTMRYTVTPKGYADFVFEIRIPHCRKATVNGVEVVAGEMCRVKIATDDVSVIDVVLEYEPFFVDGYKNLKSLRYGNLLFALPLKTNWERVDFNAPDGTPRHNYFVRSNSRFGYAFSSEPELFVSMNKPTDVPYSEQHPPVEISMNLKSIDWGFHPQHDNCCAELPNSVEPLGTERRTFVPYGCARLRMTELPVIPAQKETAKQ